MQCLPQRRLATVAAATLLAATSGRGAPSHTAKAAADVALVRGTTSLPNAAEQNFAQSLTRTLDRWLSDVCVSHDVLDDREIAAGRLARARIAILGYNALPPQQELACLASFVRRGGKLIVFYSSSEPLAKLMDVRLGPPLSAAAPRWSLMRFNDAAPPHLPRLVRQDSRIIRPAYPLSSGAKIIATWQTAGGDPLPDPAWVQSAAGFWMTHVLRDDGDTEDKKRLLLGLIAFHLPNAWVPAAREYLGRCGRLGSFPDLTVATRTIGRLARGSGREEDVNASLAQAQALCIDAIRLANASLYPDAIDRCLGVQASVTRAYALVQRPRPGEIRAVWDHAGTGLYAGQWPRTCKVLARSGITDIFQNVLWPYMAHFDSRVLPPSDILRINGDQLASSIAAAHRLGIRVHAWKVCWNAENAPPEFLSRMKKLGRLQISDSGQTVNWLCPSNPDNIRYEKDAVRDLLSRYEVDGIQLDYARYRDDHVCYCPGCRTRFAQETGRTYASWPGGVAKGEGQDAYNRWRCRQIRRLVVDIKALSRAVRPSVRVSAAVYGWYPGCVQTIAQDWGEWLKNGDVDFICPMNYTLNRDHFRELTRAQLALPGAAGRVIPGIGVTAIDCRLDAVQVIDQVNVLRQEGAAGFALFDLDHTLETDVLPILALGITAER